MSETDKGQVTARAAEVYEDFFVPALFAEWATRMVDAGGIKPGQSVLDVACGTGVLARAVFGRVGSSGLVAGLDINEGMLAVARRKAPEIMWRHGRAEALPFEGESFDAVVSQFGLMFFEDRVGSVREMMRVARHGARVTVAVWDRLESSPGYEAVALLLERLFGEEISMALRMPFVLGDKQTLGQLFEEAGVTDPQITTHEGTARFQSIRDWMYTDVKGWTLADRLDDNQYEQLLREAERTLQQFAAADGRVTFRMPALIVTVVKV